MTDSAFEICHSEFPPFVIRHSSFVISKGGLCRCRSATSRRTAAARIVAGHFAVLLPHLRAHFIVFQFLCLHGLYRLSFWFRACPDNPRGPRDECHLPEPEEERPRISGRDTQGRDDEGGGQVPPSPCGLGPKSRPASLLVGHGYISYLLPPRVSPDGVLTPSAGHAGYPDRLLFDRPL